MPEEKEKITITKEDLLNAAIQLRINDAEPMIPIRIEQDEWDRLKEQGFSEEYLNMRFYVPVDRIPTE